MTNTDATNLLRKIKSIWRGGPGPDAWLDLLADLDAGTAGTTIVRLARTHDDPPSIALFLRTYRQLDTPANNPIPTHTPAHCLHCDDGWTTVTNPTGNPAVTPCTVCRTRTDVHHRIIEHNDRTLAHIRHQPDDDELMPLSDPRAQAAFARGYAQALAERAEGL